MGDMGSFVSWGDRDSQVLERDGKLGELDQRTDALQVHPPLKKLLWFELVFHLSFIYLIF